MEKINRLILTARYAETDMMGIIHHSVYPVWFEAARTEYIKMTGVSYSELEKKGIMLPLSELSCQYLKPVHYEDRVTIETTVSRLSYSRIEFTYRVLLSGELMAKGRTLHGFVGSSSFRPLNMKKAEPELYELLDSAVVRNTDNNGASDLLKEV